MNGLDRDVNYWLQGTQEEILAKWARGYQTAAVARILKTIQRTDLQPIWTQADGDLLFSRLVHELGFPVWLAPRKVKELDKLITVLMARPTKSTVYAAYLEVCEEIPVGSGGCDARGIVFNWPHHSTYMVFHDLQHQPMLGHGWFFHRRKDKKRFTLQPLDSLVEGLGTDGRG